MANKKKRKEIESETEAELLNPEALEEAEEPSMTATPEPVIAEAVEVAPIVETIEKTHQDSQEFDEKPDQNATEPQAQAVLEPAPVNDADDALQIEKKKRWLKRRRR
jgi:hypothetical protein